MNDSQLDDVIRLIKIQRANAILCAPIGRGYHDTARLPNIEDDIKVDELRATIAMMRKKTSPE